VLAQPEDLAIEKIIEHLLARAPSFRHLELAQLRTILDLARIKKAVAGTTIFSEGQSAQQFYLLLSGYIRLTRVTAEGDRVIVLHVPPGQIFGIGTPLGHEIRQEAAIAANDCLLISWPTPLWQVFSENYVGFNVELLRAFGARADEMSNRIVELSTKLVEQKVACALLRMITQSGHKVEGGIEIDFPISRQNIADMTGTTLHTVSRVLSAWEKLGLIHSTRCHIVVTDPHWMVVRSDTAGPMPAEERPNPTAAHLHRYA